jgi:hypothetical protein
MKTRALLTAICVALAAGLLAATAFAAPPTGHYPCTSGYSIDIKPNHRYKFEVGNGGRFAYSRATHRIQFKTGYLHRDWFGYFKHDANTGDPIIKLILKDGSGGDFCEK